jgi:hypothetical protein
MVLSTRQGDPARFAKIEQDLAIIKWMLGFVIASVALLIVKASA